MERTLELASVARCIVCEQESARLTRGLCPKGYERYRRELNVVAAERRGDFDTALVSAGMLFESRQGKQSAPSEDAFAEFLDRFLTS